jgi:alpha-glucosidase
VVQRIAKDPRLRDNPELDPSQGYGGQRHLHDENHPDVHRLLRGLRKLANRYPERAYVGEVYLMNPAEVARYYGRNDELHLAFNFSFLNAPWSADAFRRETERFQRFVGRRGWPDQVLSSHDAPRHASRYDHETLGDARARLAALMLLTLRGTPFLYQGEEIGMRNVPVPDARLQDPLAFRLHPKLSRDPSRTPLPWQRGPGAGFTTGEPWLPIGADSEQRNVAAQREDPDSLLQLYRALLALRKRNRRFSVAARRARAEGRVRLRAQRQPTGAGRSTSAQPGRGVARPRPQRRRHPPARGRPVAGATRARRTRPLRGHRGRARLRSRRG